MSETSDALRAFMKQKEAEGALLEAVVYQERDGTGACAIDPNGANIKAYEGRVKNMICTLAFAGAMGDGVVAVVFLGDASHMMQHRVLGKCGQCGQDA